MSDHYTYPGTNILVNLPGYSDPVLWKSAETAVIGQHLRELSIAPIPGSFDLSHLQAIHARLVDGFYAWGGILRDTNTGPGGTGIAHCRPEFITAEADRVLTALAGADHLRGCGRGRFAEGLAWVWGEMTAIHPFRDVNTRSQFVFFNQLATEAGWVIDWNLIDPYVFAHARTVAIVHDEEGLEALLYPALLPATENKHSKHEEQTPSVPAGIPQPKAGRSLEVLDKELQQAIKARQSFTDGPPPFPRQTPWSLRAR